MDDDVELRRLRERVYGAAGADATPAMVQRLAELEDRIRPAVGAVGRPASSGDPEPASHDEFAPAPHRDLEPASHDEFAPAPHRDPEPASRGETAPADATADVQDVDELPGPAARPFLRGILTAIGAFALVGVGVAIGATATATASMPGATVDPAAARYPELTFPQTIEDAISADILRDSAIDSGSTRYIATVSGFRIYLAQPQDGNGRCIVTFTDSDDTPWSAGCASGAQEGAAVFGIVEGLTVAIGDPDESQVSGIPIRLSESVTAYVAGGA